MVDVLLLARLVGGAALLLGNGFFVTAEFALTRVRQFPESEFDTPGLERAWEMTERLEIFLSGCQLGITVCSVGLGIVAEPAVAALFGGLLGAVGLGGAGGHAAASVLLAYGLINLLHVVVGEQMPTYLGIERAKFVASYTAAPLYWWTRVMYPFIATADWTAKALLSLLGVEITRSWTEEGEGPTTRSELRSEMGSVLAQADLPEERVDEVINALDIGETTVAEIMVPIERAVVLSTEDDFAANRHKVEETPHVRYPLVGEDVNDVRGIVYAPQLLAALDDVEAGETTMADLAAPPMTVGPTTTVATLIDMFQAENQELAVVIDREARSASGSRAKPGDDGEAVGIVTTTDAFETITGQLQDPLDLELDHVE